MYVDACMHASLITSTSRGQERVNAGGSFSHSFFMSLVLNYDEKREIPIPFFLLFSFSLSLSVFCLHSSKLAMTL
ncbi:hypothetical protein CSUI_007281, partial [Cystoisospora suis]